MVNNYSRRFLSNILFPLQFGIAKMKNGAHRHPPYTQATPPFGGRPSRAAGLTNCKGGGVAPSIWVAPNRKPIADADF